MCAVTLCLQYIPAYDDVKEQVSVENQDVPEEHRIWRGIKPHIEIRIGCPRSTRTKRRHITSEAIARNSPRIVILPKAL